MDIFKLQKRAARMIYDLPTGTPTAPLLKQLNWMPLMDRIKYRKAVMVFKSLNGLAPQYMKELFQFVGEVSCRSTRNSDVQVSLFRIYCRTWTNVKKLKFAPILVWDGTNHVNFSFELGSFTIIIR